MNIIDHGEWEGYEPTEYPANVPQWAMFARRKTDLVDWYVYIYPDVDPPPPLELDQHTLQPLPIQRSAPVAAPRNIGEDTIKLAASWRPMYNAYLVGPVTKDATQIFPAHNIVFEITDYPGTESEAFAEFNGKAYDPATGEFTDPVPVEPIIKSAFQEKVEELSSRIVELEKEVKRMAQTRG